MNKERIGDVAEILLNYLEQGKTFQGDEVTEVPANSYTDPSRWRAEIEHIFKRVPLMLALSCELPELGDYKAMEVVGLPVLIARDKSGRVRTFLNVCAHRWSPVAPQGYGNCSRFTCPFHGWTYGADGKLIGVADQRKFGDIDKSRRGLRELPCEERHGMIFGCLTPGMTINLDEYYGAFLEEFADAGLKHWTFLGTHVVEGANWKLTFNNFLESYHFSTLHANSVGTQLLSNMTHYEGFGPNIRLSVSFNALRDLRQLPRGLWGDREGQEFGFIRIFFPNVTGYLASDPNISAFTQTLPGDAPDKSRIVTLYLRKSPIKDEADRTAVESAMKAINDLGDNEDNAINVQIQKGLNSGAHEGLLYGRNERGNQYFQEWLDWYLKDCPNTPKPVL